MSARFLAAMQLTVSRPHSLPVCLALCSMYESRILASHHALLSTYALESMVLAVLNNHHSTLHTPLQVS